MIRAVRLLVTMLAVLGLVTLGSGSASAATAPTSAPTSAHGGTLSVPVTGTGQTPAGTPGTFSGTATITNFQNQGGVLTAVGTLSGVFTDANGNQTTVPTTPFSTPVTATDPSCQILSLQTGPIYLNLLGLVVNVAPINITITAQQGAGNLLGNLLCAVANLLNQPASLTALANLLNQILAAL